VPSSLEATLLRPVQFFTGKGGVGKSSVLSAVAVALARAGKRPLIVELGVHSSSGHLLDGPEVGYEPVRIAPGVDASRVLFEPALIDYINERLKLRPVSTMVARNGSLRRLFSAAPGVDEIVALHRVAELAADSCWDLVLVDLESTGHALMFFDLPSVLDVFLKDGPLRQVMDRASDLVRDPARCAVHIVTAPQPLVVRETVELYQTLRSHRQLHLGGLFINLMPRQWLDAKQSELVERLALQASERDEPWSFDLAVAKYWTDRRLTAEKCLAGLQRDIPLPSVILQAHTGDGGHVIEELANELEQSTTTWSS